MDFLIKVVRKFQNAIVGILTTLREEKTILLQFFYGAFVTILGILFHISFDEWAILTICIFSNIVIEMINSAMENFLDLVTFNYDLKIKKIKDIFAGASLVFSVSVIIVSGFILIPAFIVYINAYTSS